MVTVKRGQLLTSYRQMSDRTGVPIKTLRVLIGKLQDEDAIGTDMGTGRLLITICNYDKYQADAGAKGTAKGTPRAQQGHTKETREQEDTLEAKASTAPEDSADPVKVMFDAGRRLLLAAGKSPAAAGKILGKWRSEHGVEAVIAALGEAQRHGAIEPVAYIERSLRNNVARPRDAPRPGDQRTAKDGTIRELTAMGEWVEVRQ